MHHIIVTGSRTVPEQLAHAALYARLSAMGDPVRLFVHVGDSKCWDPEREEYVSCGVDDACVKVCKLLGIRGRQYVADWERFPKTAGFVRDDRALKTMLAESEPGKRLCLAMPMGKAPGTRDMIRKCERAMVPVETIKVCVCACHKPPGDPCPQHPCCDFAVPF